MRRALLTVVLLFCCVSSSIATIRRVEFLGWSPDSRALALRVLTIDKSKKTKTEVIFQRLDKTLKLTRMRVESADPLAYVRAQSYVVSPLSEAQLSPYVTVFKKAEREVLRFELVVAGHTLHFKVATKDRRKRWKTSRKGLFRELYVTVKPSAYLSPDGKKVVLLIHKRTPYTLHDSVLVFITRY